VSGVQFARKTSVPTQRVVVVVVVVRARTDMKNARVAAGGTMDNLHPLFGPVLVLTVASVAAHIATTLYLMQVLNRTFDPFWVPQMLFPPVGFGQKYKWALFYSGAVLFKSVRQSIFENQPFDFRAQVSRTTVVVCVVQQLFAIAAIAGTVTLAVFGLSTLWTWWQDLPRPDDKKPPPIDPATFPM
jgi:hypothetical protein